MGVLMDNLICLFIALVCFGLIFFVDKIVHPADECIIVIFLIVLTSFFLALSVTI